MYAIIHYNICMMNIGHFSSQWSGGTIDCYPLSPTLEKNIIKRGTLKYIFLRRDNNFPPHFKQWF